MKAKFGSWSMSRLRDYEQCPKMAALKHLEKLCTICFKGKLLGGFDGVPITCDVCGKTPEEPAPLARGSEVGATLETYINGTGRKLHKEIRHPKIIALAKEFRKGFKQGRIFVETTLYLDKDWRPILNPKRDFNKIWLRAKLDVLAFLETAAAVTDWKTGGIDKRTGAPKESEEYVDQLSIYNTAVMSFHPELIVSTAGLAFVDCAPRHDPIIYKEATGSLLRKDVPKAQKYWNKKVKAMLTDEAFAPRMSYRCAWCPFSRTAGGPCPVA
jgi:hypothetical protein